MTTPTKGFTPSHSEESIAQPLVSFSIILVGLMLGAFGGLFKFLEDLVHFGALPITMIIIGIILVTGGSTYLITRNTSIAQARSSDETRFADWVQSKYGIELNHEQVDELYNYGATTVRASEEVIKYVLHYDLLENAYYVYSEAQLLEEAHTEAIEIIHNTHTHAIPVIEVEKAEIAIENVTLTPANIETLTESIEEEVETVPEEPIKEELAATIEQGDVEEEPSVVEDPSEHATPELSTLTLAQLKAVAKERGMKGYSKLNKAQLIARLSE